MGTRCNIVIDFGDSRSYVYRHWDGYLAVTGRDIHNKLVNTGTDASAFMTALLTSMEENPGYRPAKAEYELTTSIHGDIEYLYYVKFDDGRKYEPEIGWAQFRPGDDRPRRINGNVVLGSRETFKADVNNAIRLMNQRIAEAKSKQSQTCADAELIAVLA